MGKLEREENLSVYLLYNLFLNYFKIVCHMADIFHLAML